MRFEWKGERKLFSASLFESCMHQKLPSYVLWQNEGSYYRNTKYIGRSVTFFQRNAASKILTICEFQKFYFLWWISTLLSDWDIFLCIFKKNMLMKMI